MSDQCHFRFNVKEDCPTRVIEQVSLKSVH